MSILWDADRVAEGLREVGECRAPMLEALRELLNAYHGEHRSAAHYDLLAGMWLEQFMDVTYAAFTEVRAGGGGSGRPGSWLELPVTPTPQAFCNLVVDDEGYAQSLRGAISQLVEGLASPSFSMKVRDSAENIVLRPVGWGARGFSALRRSSSLVRARIGNSKDGLLICEPYFKGPRAEWLGALWRWRRWARHDDLAIAYPTAPDCDVAWRARRSIEQQGSVDFPGVLRRLLPLAVPSVFLEGFDALRRSVLGAEIVRPRAVYTANALHWNIPFKLLAAEWREHGTLILDHQHGAGYGIDKVHTIEDYETRVADRFYSWGWQRSDRRVRPLGVGIAQLSRATPRIGVLLSCVNYPRPVYRLHYQPMPGTIETVIRETLAFLRALGTHDDVMVRPYITDYRWGLTEAMQKAAPTARFDLVPRPSVFARLEQCRVIVHNTPGTGFLETLASNVPTVCFFQGDAYRFRDAAAPFMTALQEVGILHTSGADAARVVRMSPGALDAWWRSAAVQSARVEFCDRYALFTRDWAKRWETEFQDVLALAT